MSRPNYTLWVNPDGEPVYIELGPAVSAVDEDAMRTVAQGVLDARRAGRLVILAPGWEIRVLAPKLPLPLPAQPPVVADGTVGMRRGE